MSGERSPRRPRRHFTVEEANKALPLVRAIVNDIVSQSRAVEELHQRLGGAASTARRIKAGDTDSGREADPYAEEVAATRSELEAEGQKLLAYIQELEKLGVELKGTDGLCDFPSLREGREVYLCWRLGEPEVMFWHELQDGFAGRQRLVPGPTLKPMKV